MALSLSRKGLRDVVGLDIDGGYLAAVEADCRRVGRAVSGELPAGLVSDGEASRRRLSVHGSRHRTSAPAGAATPSFSARRAAFVKPGRAGRHKLVLVFPAVGRLHATGSGGADATRLELRVILRRKVSRWTRKRLSSVVVPD